jgi:hypothetical protein
MLGGKVPFITFLGTLFFFLTHNKLRPPQAAGVSQYSNQKNNQSDNLIRIKL